MAKGARMDTTGMMRLYGYPKDQDLDSPLNMGEVTIVADSQTLRQLASYLNHAAKQMEEHRDSFGHEHYSDFVKDRVVGSPEIVVNRL
jgi:hypothetical protein